MEPATTTKALRDPDMIRAYRDAVISVRHHPQPNQGDSHVASDRKHPAWYERSDSAQA